MLLLLACICVALPTPAHAVPSASVKREVPQLHSTYDFVIAGAGTTGLTVADRLTEALPQSRESVIGSIIPVAAQQSLQEPFLS